MSRTQNTNTPIRRMISILVILTLLAIFLSLYFFKFVPQQKMDFHQRAFTELEQIMNAFKNRDLAYQQVIISYLETDASYVKGSLENTFPKPRWMMKPESFQMKLLADDKKDSLTIKKTFDQDSSGAWVLTYKPTVKRYNVAAPQPIADLSKSLDSILNSLTATYNDIFDNYVMILDHHGEGSDGGSGTPGASGAFATPVSDAGRDRQREGEIIFNSGQLSLDYLVNTDTLLKKSDGFSLLNIHDVKIEGSDYKLFLFPVKFSDKRIIMGGLVSIAHYTQAYESIPIGLVTTGGILLLMLILAIPLLKIYIIGAHERITSFDLRMIIGTYFLGSFLVFFLFSRNFMESVGSTDNKTHLTSLADALQDSLYTEIHAACRQLKKYDAQYDTGSLENNYGVKNGLPDILGQSKYKQDTLSQNDSLHPYEYLQMDNVFWIDSTGKWVGRWGFKQFPNLPLICVSDRDYFKDMVAKNILILENHGDRDSLSLQPTLGKLDGQYVVNVLIRSRSGRSRPLKDGRYAVMLGLTAKMYSVCNPVLPCGYGFSIIDNDGNILFDSKLGRSLLSNIFAEIPDHQSIRQSVEYRQERFFASTFLRGKETALFLKPLPGMPYTALVYYNKAWEDEFQIHVLGLSCFFTGSIILLLILSAFCNEWSKTGPSLSNISLVNFEWLRAIPAKFPYYRHFLKGLSALLFWYIIGWVAIEIFFRRHEFSLLVISLLLPFHAAMYYFLMREKQKAPCTDTRLRLPVPALLLPAISIFIIIFYNFFSDLNIFNKLLTGAVELIFLFTIRNSLKKFKPADAATGVDPESTLRLYVSAIILGLFSTIIFPSSGIFCFFYKAEMKTRLKEEKLSMAKSIDERRIAILQNINQYDFDRHNPRDSLFLHGLKFEKGIYYPDRTSGSSSIPPGEAGSSHPAGVYYDLRNFLFPGDSTILTLGNKPEVAGDLSWFFRPEGKAGLDSELLIYKNRTRNLYEDSIQLPVAHISRLTALGLMARDAGSLGATNIILFFITLIILVGLIYRLTASLTGRIFLGKLFSSYPEGQEGKDGLKNRTYGPTHVADLRENMKKAGFGPYTAKTIKEFEEYGKPASGSSGNSESPLFNQDWEQRLLYVQTQMDEAYRDIWNNLSDQEQFVLYDFAIDGLANYKSGMPLYTLIQKGILYIGDDHQLHLMTHSFHNFVLDQSDSEAIVKLMKKSREQGSWQNLKLPLFLILASVGIFVFLTQDAIYQKMTGLLASIGSLVPLISRFFDKSSK